MSIIRNFNSKIIRHGRWHKKKNQWPLNCFPVLLKKYLMKNLIFPKGVKVGKIRCPLNQFLQIVHYLVSKAEAMI